MSTTAALRNVATGQVAERPKDLLSLMASGAVKAQIANALPKHMTADRMARIAMTELRRVPALQKCDPMSFLGAVMQASQLGLEPGGALGHVYLIPFGKEVQVIVGYRGMIDIARRSGQIVSIEARAVYDGDRFDCVLGLDSNIEHVPDWQNVNRTDPAKLRFVYAVAKLKDGGMQFDIMSRAEVDAIRKRSKSNGNGPWVTDYAAMALKSVVRRLFKFLPVSIEMQTAIGIDEQADAGIAQQNAALLSAEYASEEPAQIEDATPVEPAGPAPTFAELRERINKADSMDVLEMVGEDVAAHEPEDQRSELLQALNARGVAIKKGA